MSSSLLARSVGIEQLARPASFLFPYPCPNTEIMFQNMHPRAAVAILISCTYLTRMVKSTSGPSARSKPGGGVSSQQMDMRLSTAFEVNLIAFLKRNRKGLEVSEHRNIP